MLVQKEEEFEAMMAAPNRAFYVPEPRYDVRDYVLPLGKEHGRWNPRNPEEHPFGKDWLACTTSVICRRTDQSRTRPSRVIHSTGYPMLHSDSDGIGQRFLARHDQTGAKLGEYTIVGLVMYNADGDVCRWIGDTCPGIKLAMCVYK